MLPNARATLVLPDGSEREVAVAELAIGHRVIVKPGDAFPADGTVAKGKSASDESALTGEAVPVEKNVGDAVFSGTLNLWGVVEYEVTRLPSESTLQKIIRLIQTAQKLRAPSERFTDKFGAGYSIVVLAACAAMFLVWWLGFGLEPFTNTPGVRSAGVDAPVGQRTAGGHAIRRTATHPYPPRPRRAPRPGIQECLDRFACPGGIAENPQTLRCRFRQPRLAPGR